MSDLFIAQLEHFNLFDSYLRCIEKILITDREYAELKKLGMKKVLDFEKIEESVKKGKIEITSPPKKQKMEQFQREGLSGGELEAVANYSEYNARFIVTEDDFLRANQKKFNVNCLSFADSIWYMANKGVITKKKAIHVLEQLKKMGWYQAEVIDSIKEELNGSLPSLSSKQLEKFISVAEEYENLNKSLNAAAEEVGITTFEFLSHYIKSGRTLKYGIEDFRKAKKAMFKYLDPNYPPNK